MAFVSDAAIFKCGICSVPDKYFKLGRSKREEHVTRWDTKDEDGSVTQLNDTNEMLICVKCEVECRIKELAKAVEASVANLDRYTSHSAVIHEFRRAAKGDKRFHIGQSMNEARKWIERMKNEHQVALDADFVESKIAIQINRLTLTSSPQALPTPWGNRLNETLEGGGSEVYPTEGEDPRDARA